jgi:hypothetical protein
MPQTNREREEQVFEQHGQNHKTNGDKYLPLRRIRLQQRDEPLKNFRQILRAIDFLQIAQQRHQNADGDGVKRGAEKGKQDDEDGNVPIGLDEAEKKLRWCFLFHKPQHRSAFGVILLFLF